MSSDDSTHTVDRAAIDQAIAALRANDSDSAIQSCLGDCEAALAHLEILEHRIQERAMAREPTAEEMLVRATITRLLSAMETLEILALPSYGNGEAGTP